MKNNILHTVTVGIPAFNEEENIGHLLDSLCSQTTKHILLREVIVYTDGSADKTPKIVKEKIKLFSRLYLVRGSKHKGKFFRLNKIFKENSSDILIVLDADIGIISSEFIENFAMAIVKDNGAQLVSAHELPIIPKTFIGKLISASYVLWDYIRWSIPNKDHVQNLYGRATAYRGTFAKKLRIPKGATEERLYLYLMAKRENGYRYTDNVSINYWPVNTIDDFLKLSDRAFGRPQPAVNKIFGYDTTYLYRIPAKYKSIGALKAFIKDPLFTPFGVLFAYILNKMTLSRRTDDSPIWEVATSSKRKVRI